MYPNPIYRPSPTTTVISIQDIPRNLSDFDQENDRDFKQNSPFQKGVVSEIYKRPGKSYFQEPQEL